MLTMLRALANGLVAPPIGTSRRWHRQGKKMATAPAAPSTTSDALADSETANAANKEDDDAEMSGELAEIPAEPETLEGRAAAIQEKLDATYRQIGT